MENVGGEQYSPPGRLKEGRGGGKGEEGRKQLYDSSVIILYVNVSTVV